MERYYLALGDSITTGYGVGGRGFAFIYYAYLQSLNHNLKFINCGVNGLTTDGLNYMLFSNQLRRFVEKAEIITITIGSNDLLKYALSTLRGVGSDAFKILANMERNFDFVGLQIRQINPRVIIKVGTIYCPVLAYQYYQYSRQSQKTISKANKIIRYTSMRYRFNIVPIDNVFRGRELLFIGKDHIHPNLLGHQIIAEECIRN